MLLRIGIIQHNFPEKFSFFGGGTAVELLKILVQHLRFPEAVALGNLADGIVGSFQFPADRRGPDLVNILQITDTHILLSWQGHRQNGLPGG